MSANYINSPQSNQSKTSIGGTRGAKTPEKARPDWSFLNPAPARQKCRVRALIHLLLIALEGRRLQGVFFAGRHDNQLNLPFLIVSSPLPEADLLDLVDFTVTVQGPLPMSRVELPAMLESAEDEHLMRTS